MLPYEFRLYIYLRKNHLKFLLEMLALILVAIKTAVDLNSHLRERRKFSRNR